MSKAPAQGAARQTEPRVLRVGIIHNGRPIEERLFRKKEAVTVGQTPKQTFCVPVAGVPKAFTFFEVHGSDYHLCFDESMTGRLSLGEGVHDLASLRKGGKAQKSGDRWSVKLTDRSRGKVVVGQVTILFQFVVPPPPRPKPQLPASMQGGWLRGMDWNFALIMVVSAIVHIGSIVWVESHDWPEPRNVGVLPDRFVAILKPPEDKDIDKTDEKVELEPVEGEGEAGPAEDEKPEPKKGDSKPVDPDQRAKIEANRKKALASKVENKTILKTIGTLGGEGRPSLVDSLTGGAAKKGLDEAFAGSEGVAQASADVERSGLNRAGSSDASGTGAKAGIGDLGGVSSAKDAGKVDSGDKREAVKVTAQVNIRSPEKLIGDGLLDKSAVSAVISRQKSAVQSCYERELKKNPNIGGKLLVQFTIGTAGRVTSASVVSDSVGAPAVGQCVISRIQSWRFPKPDGGSVTVSKAFIFASSK